GGGAAGARNTADHVHRDDGVTCVQVGGVLERDANQRAASLGGQIDDAFRQRQVGAGGRAVDVVDAGQHAAEPVGAVDGRDEWRAGLELELDIERAAAVT